jgi:hypothetical protein
MTSWASPRSGCIIAAVTTDIADFVVIKDITDIKIIMDTRDITDKHFDYYRSDGLGTLKNGCRPETICFSCLHDCLKRNCKRNEPRTIFFRKGLPGTVWRRYGSSRNLPVAAGLPHSGSLDNMNINI